jgi:hypothetical protein
LEPGESDQKSSFDEVQAGARAQKLGCPPCIN